MLAIHLALSEADAGNDGNTDIFVKNIVDLVGLVWNKNIFKKDKERILLPK